MGASQKFFGRLFGRLIRGCESFHEPDCVAGEPLRDFLSATRRFGPGQVVLGKLWPMGNMKGLSIGRMTGRVAEKPAAQAVEKLRAGFVRGISGSLYVESNHQLAGLVDVLPRVFQRCRIVYLVRDVREWLRSFWSHSGGFYRTGDLMRYLSSGRLRAPMCPGDPYADRWKDMDRFQKNCWLWAKKNRYALECVKGTDEARMWRFEDVFLGDRRYDTLEELVEFTTQFLGGERFEHDSLEGVLAKEVNASEPGALPPWQEWSVERVRAVREICGGLMGELGYGDEPEWRRMCRNAGGLH